MGQSKSKAAVENLSKQIANVSASTVQNCVVSSDQSQSGVINNTGWSFWTKVKLEQKTDVSSSCFSDVNKQTELRNNIINTIANASTAEGVGLLGAFGSSTASAKTNLVNIIESNVKMSNIQQSYTSIKQKQTLEYNNSGISVADEVELLQGAKLFAAATLKELDKTGIFNTIENYVDQKADAKVKSPLDIFSSMYFMLFIGFIILCIVGAGAYFLLQGGGGDDDVRIQFMDTAPGSPFSQ